MATAEQLAAGGDTSQALDVLDRAARRFPDVAQIHFRRGVLLSRTASSGLSDHFRRAAAQQSLERALRLDRGNPSILLELARLRLKTPFMRFAAGRLFRQAEQAARDRADPRLLADVLAELGALHMRRADVMAHRRALIGGVTHFDADRALEDWRYTESFLTRFSSEIPDAGDADRRQAEDRFRAALAAWPAQEDAAGALLALLHDEQRFEEYLAVARQFARAAPQSGRARLALGLGLVRAGRESEAQAAFDSSLALMDPAERSVVLDLSPILRRLDAVRYRNLDEADRRETERVFWAGRDPLRLTPSNEYRVEHLARVAYAQLRFAAPELRLAGWETDRGMVYIRYGPPPVIAAFAPESDWGEAEQQGRITTVWWYPDRKLRFVFYNTPGYNYARLAGEFGAYAEEARHQVPALYDNAPVSAALDSVPLQIARFRAGSLSEVVVYAGIPVSRMLSGVELDRGTLETGLFVADREQHEVLARRRQESVAFAQQGQWENRTYEANLRTGDYEVRVEAREPTSRRSARGQMTLSVPIPGPGLELSDVVLAARVGPRNDSARNRRDYFIEPNPEMAFSPGRTVHLYWETYGLVPDTSGAVVYTVAVTVRLASIARRGVLARVVGGFLDRAGLSAEGEDRATVSYTRQLSLAGRDRIPETLEIDLAGSPAGTYVLELAVRDGRSGEQATRTRTFTVRETTAP